ncbi:MAG: molybdopterin-dependent oxidoreductase [Anaerolineales bacterium]|nr:molybdopterin-dependent oxidoreductase [Anaerolineales bacterium]
MSTIGQSTNRIDAMAKVTGTARYPGDLNRPGQLHMKILFAGLPHARIRRLDTTRAEQYPGVVAVFTAKDVPNNEYGLGVFDQPVLCGPGSEKVGANVVRFVGDQVALVVAESEKAAAAARGLIEVDYEDLPVVTDPRASMQPGALRLFPDRENVLAHYRIRKGDVEAAWAGCDAVVEGEYHTPMQEHAYLQPEAGLAYIDEHGRVTVEVAGQWAHEDQEQIAHALGLPREQVRVIYPAIGGAFGGREDMSVQIVLALAVWRLAQRGVLHPVKIIWSREESIVGHHKRHQFFIRAKWGAKRDGCLVAAEVEVISDAGAYAYTSTKVLGNATLMCTGPYVFPNARVDAYTVYTNNVPGGAFRGFGGPQGAFAAELQLEKLAEKLGLDPIEMRMKNVLVDGALSTVGTPFPKGVTIDKVVARCAAEAGWQPGKGLPAPSSTAAPWLKRGRGFACAFKNIGFSFGAAEACEARVELHGDGRIERVVVYHAGADVGQGAHTVMSQMAAEAAGVPVSRVELVASDTASSGTSGSASASRLTFMSGNAIRGAVARALQNWQDEERPAAASYTYHPPATTPLDPETGYSNPNFAYGYVAEAVEVEVDVETGHVRLVDVICADDVGRAINPRQVEGQIEGAVVQAAGYAILENFIVKDGHVLTPFLSNYLIPTVLDVPERVKSLILEYAEPNGPFGARGMAEMPYLPLAPAIAAAIHAATGLWIDEFPYTPDRVLTRLRAAEAG